MIRLGKTFTSSVVSLLLISLTTGFAFADRIGIVNCDTSLNLRETPNTSSKVVTQFVDGTNVSILEESNGWYKVNSNGTTGWVYGKYVTVKNAAATNTATVNADNLNFRSGPGLTHLVLSRLGKGEKVTLLERSGDWSKVKTVDGLAGWVFGEYITLVKAVPIKASRSESTVVPEEKKTETATVTASGLNFRSAPTLDAEVISKLNWGDKLTLIEKSGDWCKVKTASGTVGWVFHEYITVGNVENTNSNKGEQMVAYGKKFMGVPYVYGGASPSGFDCSGFVQYVYRHFGISIERVAANQAKQGTWVAKSNLQPGDLVFFDTNGGHNYINHVGMYIGNGQFIHASSGSNSKRVVISDLSSGFYANAFMTAKRFI